MVYNGLDHISTLNLDHIYERNTDRCIVEEEEFSGGICKRVKGMFWVLLCGCEEKKKRRDEEVESDHEERGFDSLHGGRRERDS